MTVASRRSLPRLPRHVVQLPEPRSVLDKWPPLLVVRGIQGYGKTTLVAAWLHENQESVRWLWVGAGPDGGDIRGFGTRLFEELHQAGLDEAAANARERDERPPDNLKEGPLDILDRAAAAVGEDEPIVLVIDDAHWLRDKAMLTGLVRVLARHKHVHLVMCSRGRHPIEDLAAGTIDTMTVRPRSLLLSVPQVRQLARSMGVHLPQARADQIHSSIGGWPAAVRLVLDEIAEAGGELPLTRAGDYLREVVLPGIIDQQALGQVMRFALAERLTHRLIRDLAGDKDPQNLVRIIESSGLAERRYDQDDVELVFPRLIRDTLRARFAAREPQESRCMHRRLSAWYDTNDGPNHPLMAMSHAVAGEDWDQLDSLWAHHAAQLGQEHPGALSHVLGSLPEEILSARPGMQVGHAFCRVAATGLDSDEDGRMVTMNAYLGASRRIAVKTELSAMSLHDLLYVGTGFLMSLRHEGRFEDADRLSNQIEQRANTLTANGGDPGDHLSWFQLQRGITLTLRAQHAAAARHYQFSWQHRRHSAPHVAAGVAANLALTHALTGNPRAAHRWLARHREIDTSRSWGHHLIGAGAHLASALVALDQLDPDGCRSQLELLGGGSAPLELWPYVAFVEAQYGLHYGDPLTALAMLDAAQAAHPPKLSSGEAARTLLARARVDLLVAAGKGEHAQTLIGAPGSETDPAVAVASARLLLLAGDPAGARRIAAQHLWQVTTDNRSRLELVLIKAAAIRRMHEPARAAELGAQARALYRHTNLLRPFTTLPADDLGALFHTSGAVLGPSELNTIHEHRPPFPHRITLTQLTPREQLLATALATTASRQEIADQLYVSVNTVRKQLVTLYRKLGVTTRGEALTRLAQMGLSGPFQKPHDS
jgi:LuxR family transcriptional regulator, maltose regulon positive regulatory protein